eukprot:TRINITY_DN64592_c0_g1_i1.p1 TRINITY_DN64592_c0_g1~~TRINITY_DN64592_c0_g1_i1.p1  ORF type:complete len:401 (+),score=31.44 TRINITY_DN64592_c0_g1_i1:78-1280(+)
MAGFWFLRPTVVFSCLVLLAKSVTAAEDEQQSLLRESDLREQLLAGYGDKLKPPGILPLTVEITYSIAALWGIDQQNGQYSIDLFLRGHWIDSKLAYDRLLSNGTLQQLPRLNFEMEEARKSVYFPEFFFSNAIKAIQPADEFMFYVEPNGRVTYSRRFILDCRCEMRFNKLPFDSQTCSLALEAFRTRTDEVKLSVLDTSSSDKSFPKLRSNEWRDFQAKTTSGEAVYSTGGFPYVIISFTMTRENRFYISNGILPSLIFVVISYSGYWIEATSAPARVSLSTICVLITLTAQARVTSFMPVVSYSVWLTDYILGCVIFNLSAVISYSSANYARAHVTHSRQSKRQSEAEGGTESDRIDRVLHRVSASDWHMRWLFPLVFAAYNIVMFTAISSYGEDDK